MANSVHMLPTLIDLMELPSVSGMEGRSLMPILRDPEHEGPEFEVSEIFGAHHDKFSSTLRSRKWKYFRVVCPSDPTEEFLFDLKADPWEMCDLSDDPGHCATLDRCREQLDRWQRDTGMNERTRKRLDAAGLSTD